MAKAATLSLLLFRKRVWLARKGNSHLWCSGGCYLYESGPSSSDKVRATLQLKERGKERGSII